MRPVAGLPIGLALFVALARRRPHPRVPHRDEGPLLLATAITAAVEELLWRGLLLPRLQGRVGRPAALGLSSVAFAAAHGRRASPAHLSVASALGAAALAPGGLAAAATAHVAYDLLVLLDDPP